ncbi:MAG: DHH family phosphoesterase [Oscillospiraceae bacterium]|nr:DHH family phosphoesterase [Oscillospiraceae bacterium]
MIPLNKPKRQLKKPEVSVIVFVVLLAACAVASLILRHWIVAVVEFAVAVLMLLAFAVFNLSVKIRTGRIMSTVAKTMSFPDGEALTRFPLPMCVTELGGDRVLWANQSFIDLLGGRDDAYKKGLGAQARGFSTRWLLDGKSESPGYVELEGRIYTVYGTALKTQRGSLAVTYWFDVSTYAHVMEQYRLCQPNVAIILVDNYDELTKNVSDNMKITMRGAIDDRINTWASATEGLVYRTDRDRYVFIFEERYLKSIEEGKFSIMESVRDVASPGGITATLSIGVGHHGGSFRENYQYAMLSLDMAISRGGDQAVIRDDKDFTFYGGHSREVEKHTKVKSRVMASALGELLNDTSSVFIMGHKRADIDCIGAAAGVCCIARKKGKKAYIVMDQDVAATRSIIDSLRNLPDYHGVFITPQEVSMLCDLHSLLVVVDTNRPDQTLVPDLLGAFARIAVIDHHRRAADYIDKVSLNFHEPYASSASELVTELLEYTIDTSDILPAEANALLAGIVLDTKNFNVRTGSRTFDAAAFLRRSGADTIEVKKMFQNDLTSTIEKYDVIRSAKLYREDIAIARVNKTITRVLAAQAADDLLSISGILCSFVIYPDGEEVIISARSIGDVNVQVVLEKLGGGGNTATAGAQIKNKTTDEVVVALARAIDMFLDEGK